MRIATLELHSISCRDSFLDWPRELLHRLIPVKLQKLRISIEFTDMKTAYKAGWGAILAILSQRCPDIRAFEIIVRMQMDEETKFCLSWKHQNGERFRDELQKNGQVYLDELSEQARVAHCSTYVDFYLHLCDIVLGHFPSKVCSVRIAVFAAPIRLSRGMVCGIGPPRRRLDTSS